MLIIVVKIYQFYTNKTNNYYLCNMKKILSILLLISSVSFGQTLRLTALERASGQAYTIETNTLGVQQYVKKNVFLKNTVKSNTLTPNYIPKSLGTDSLGNSQIVDDGATVSINGDFKLNGASNNITQGSTTNVNTLHFDDAISHTAASLYSQRLVDVVNSYYYSNGIDISEKESTNTNAINIYSSLDAISPILVNILLDSYSNKIELNAANVNLPQLTSSKLVGTDASKNLSNIEIGSGLSLTSGTLSTTSSGSTTTVSSGTNITVSGSAPNYTVSVASALTNSVSSNTTAISTLSTNVGTNTSSITTLQSSKQNTLVAGSNITLSTNTISATTPTLSVVNATLSGSYPTQTLTIPTSSTTILTASTNITISGSAPNYTISTPTQTTGLASTSSPTITSPTFSTSTTYTYATANTVPIFNGSNNLISSSTTTTQLSYLDATSSIQTQLDATRWSKSYGFVSLSPADATNYLISGVYNQSPATSIRQFKFPKSGTLKEFSLNIVQTVNGSNETVTIYLRNLSTSTDYSIGTFTSDFGANAMSSFIYTGLSISVNTTDLWAIKIACPTWVTNPTGWQGGGELLIK